MRMSMNACPAKAKLRGELLPRIRPVSSSSPDHTDACSAIVRNS